MYSTDHNTCSNDNALNLLKIGLIYMSVTVYEISDSIVVTAVKRVHAASAAK